MRAASGAGRLRRAKCLCLALALVGCEDFPDAPTSTVTVRQPSDAPWPQEVFVKNTFILTMDVEGLSATAITGLAVDWRSTDPSVLALSPVEPEPTLEDSLVAQRSIRVVAQRRGRAEISATIAQPGIEAESLKQEVRVMERWIAVSAGGRHTCGLTIDHSALCWGEGFLGNGSVAGSVIPTPMLSGLAFKTLAAGDSFTCGLTLDGTGYCWGENDQSGRLGNGTLLNNLVPTPVASGITFSSIWAGAAYACALADAAGYCWGRAVEGQLGDAHLNFNQPPGKPDPPFDNCTKVEGAILLCSMTPRRIRPTREVDEPILLRAVGPGEDHTCGVLITGRAVCWGNHPRWGNLSLTSSDSAIPVPTTVTFDSVTSGLWHSCAIEHDTGRARCWGYNTYGQLGNETDVPVSGCDTAPCSLVPVLVAGGDAFRQVSADAYTTCGVADTGEGFCWGADDFGQLGNDSSPLVTTCRGVLCSKVPLPVELSGGRALVSISVGRSHACAVDELGAAYCWGRGTEGQLGSGSANGSTIPVRVHEPSD